MIYTLTLNPAIDRELAVPRLEFDEVLRATAVREDYGGKGFNVSRLLTAWGVENVALGFVGGYAGQKIEAGLKGLGIRTEFVKIAGETRTNISIVSEPQRRHIKVNEPGPAILPAELDALERRVRKLTRAGDWWVLSGSLPPGVPSTFYATLTGELKAAGARVVLDASGAALRAGCAAGPFLAKPNAIEAAELTGIQRVRLQAADVATAIHRLGVQHALITLGKEGALFSDRQRLLFIETPPVVEVNPIGAGDSTVAALVWSAAQGLDWEESLRWSIACGAVAAGLAGTAVPEQSRVQALMATVRITPL
ncbi:MAG: 1-phosphofructokinase [Caldilineae bacterium]|nr:MAG: 1-phosphofructokinase [Caldilineae bacterium]